MVTWVALAVLSLCLMGCAERVGLRRLERLLTRGQRWVSTSVTLRTESHDVLVYLPEGYPRDAPYPVVYLLHGWLESPESWQREDIQREADRLRLLLVAVEGDDDDITPSWYSLQADLPYPHGPDWHVSFYDWFFEGVIPWIQENYAVRDDPGGHAIAGYSMGGKGAVSLAAHRPDLFSAVAAFGGIMDIRDYAGEYEISDVYGPLAARGMSYAADNPVELASNLKGLSITLLHGAEDTDWAHYEQSRRMSQLLGDLGYPHVWEEIPGLEHDVNSYEVTRAFDRFTAAFGTPYTPPDLWHYRFAGVSARQIYSTTITKTDPLTWTMVMSVTQAGFDALSGDAFTLTTSPAYTPAITYAIEIRDLRGGDRVIFRRLADGEGTLSLRVPPGRHRVDIAILPSADR